MQKKSQSRDANEASDGWIDQKPTMLSPDQDSVECPLGCESSFYLVAECQLILAHDGN